MDLRRSIKTLKKEIMSMELRSPFVSLLCVCVVIPPSHPPTLPPTHLPSLPPSLPPSPPPSLPPFPPPQYPLPCPTAGLSRKRPAHTHTHTHTTHTHTHTNIKRTAIAEASHFSLCHTSILLCFLACLVYSSLLTHLPCTSDWELRYTRGTSSRSQRPQNRPGSAASAP